MGRKTGIERRLRIASTLVLAGLLVELTTLYWSHPTAFLVFLFLGTLLVLAGILIYLYSLVSNGQAIAEQDEKVKADPVV